MFNPFLPRNVDPTVVMFCPRSDAVGFRLWCAPGAIAQVSPIPRTITLRQAVASQDHPVYLAELLKSLKVTPAIRQEL